MTKPVDDPRSGSAGAIPSGTDMGTASRDNHAHTEAAAAGGASGSGALGESTSTGGASGSGTRGAVADDPAHDQRNDAASGGASGSGGISDTPAGASASGDADDDEDAGS